MPLIGPFNVQHTQTQNGHHSMKYFTTNDIFYKSYKSNVKSVMSKTGSCVDVISVPHPVSYLLTMKVPTRDVISFCLLSQSSYKRCDIYICYILFPVCPDHNFLPRTALSTKMRYLLCFLSSFYEDAISPLFPVCLQPLGFHQIFCQTTILVQANMDFCDGGLL